MSTSTSPLWSEGLTISRLEGEHVKDRGAGGGRPPGLTVDPLNTALSWLVKKAILGKQWPIGSHMLYKPRTGPFGTWKWSVVLRGGS